MLITNEAHTQSNPCIIILWVCAFLHMTNLTTTDLLWFIVWTLLCGAMVVRINISWVLMSLRNQNFHPLNKHCLSSFSSSHFWEQKACTLLLIEGVPLQILWVLWQHMYFWFLKSSEMASFFLGQFLNYLLKLMMCVDKRDLRAVENNFCDNKISSIMKIFWGNCNLVGTILFT